jgi:hypothetical protein
MTKWIRQPTRFTAEKEFVVTLTKRGFALNSELSDALPRRYKFAEIFISDDNEEIAFEFQAKQTQWSFKIAEPKSKRGSRVIEAAELIANNIHLSALLKGNKSDCKIVVSADGDMYSGRLKRAFMYNGASKPAAKSAVGVYRLYVGSNVVLIGSGKIGEHVDAISSNNMPFDKYEYFLTDDEKTAAQHQNDLLKEFRAAHGDMPLLNKKIHARMSRVMH